MAAFSAVGVDLGREAPSARDSTNQRVRKKDQVDELQRRKNRNKSSIRSRMDHVAVVKRLWGFNKVPYRACTKNATRAFTPFALANIYCAAIS